MAQNFIGCDREQSFLMPPDVRDWLPEGHLAWFVLEAVAGMQLGGFYDAYRRDGVGRRAYDPAMMVALLLYAYARGVRSARRIERACEEDVAFRVIAMLERPDHATIARFVARHEAALAGLFGQVLELCAQAGLVSTGVVAIDGTKLHANASRDQTVDYERIAAEILEEVKQTDAAEDELYGQARGDELPPQMATREGRRKWLREAQRQLEDKREREAQPIPGPRPARLKEAKRRLEEQLFVEQRANAAYEEYRRSGRDVTGRRLTRVLKPYIPPDTPQASINTTDLDSRLVKGMRGWIQGYNAQAATNEQQIVLAAELMIASPDFGHLEPLLTATERELAQAGVTDTPKVVLADAGYWHQEQMERAMAAGKTVLIPPDSSRRKGQSTRPGWDGGLYAFMRRVLGTGRGAELYALRQQLVEPMFANTKHNRGMGRFLRRGRSACRTEWRLITATHNLLKLHKHHLATTAA